MEGRQAVAAVVLAAGESRRFGSPKQLARLGDRTLLEHVLESARATDLTPIVAVVPIWLTRPASMDDASLVWLRNPDPQRGMSHSLQLGIAALPSSVAAAVILLGDQPMVPASHLQALLAARGDRPVVATRSAGILQPPLLLERSAFGLVDRAVGDIGLREVISDGPEVVRTVEIGVPYLDVDRPLDLHRAEHDQPDVDGRTTGRR